jgi:hypothetical protein
MARQTFPNTAEGRAAANAVPLPRHIVENPRGNWVVLTGTDMPETLDAKSVTLNKQQFLQGALTVGGQVLWSAVKAFIEDQKANGTPAQQNHWSASNEFRRRDIYTRQARLAVKGAKTEPASAAEWDQVFIVGSGYEPPLSNG